MRRYVTVLAATMALLGLGALASAARADGTPSSVAVVSPTLRMMAAGSAIGGPLMCQTAAGTVSAGAPQASPVLTVMTQQCAQYSAQGSAFFTSANHQVQPLIVVNPPVNAGLEAAANTLANVGTNYGPGVAPFGGTIASSAATVRYFEGS